ncbi:hypothetical protein HNQ94_000418 [Salirhabdus euzebyi]|uniref:Insertion element IS150 protein InsJ-like helix-turn-helix domain-containing protein n=1 Tax=Salirhabdus euzebyi TaxID=394506 RepID=A0A841PSQ5_9BACI|nr:sigma-70 family RNA polymerase sigma factor [Salirhabdus euzebyi]MBB6451997.1 hypothetical protein [Salirhabdus euzebyi]
MNKKKIENLIYEYHWRKKEMDRLENILFGSTIPIRGSVGVSKYGIEATLPRGTSLKSKAELEAMDKREERLYERWVEYREKVFAIELVVDKLDDEYHLIIIDCMMEGMSYRAIAAHLGYSRSKLRELKDDMLNQICQKCHFVHDLILKKTTV